MNGMMTKTCHLLCRATIDSHNIQTSLQSLRGHSKICKWQRVTLRSVSTSPETPPLINKQTVHRSTTQSEDGVERNSHWLKDLLPSWQNVDDLYRQLENRIIYEDDHVIALDKPVDLPVHHHSDECIKSFLPTLKRSRGSEVMETIFTTNRNYSGVMLLAKTKRAVDIFTQYFTHCRINKVFCQRYRIITLAPPPEVEYDDEIIVELNKLTTNLKVTIQSERKSVPRRDSGKKSPPTALMSAKMKTIRTHKLDTNCTTALLELATPTVKFDAIQLYLLHKLAPILGDHMYSGRLKYVMNKPVLKEHYLHDHANQIQELPRSVSEALLVEKLKHVKQIPLYIHCTRLLVPMVNDRNNHLGSKKFFLKCPLPSYFKKTMTQLGLDPRAETDT